MYGLKIKSGNKLPLEDYKDVKNLNPGRQSDENGIRNAIR